MDKTLLYKKLVDKRIDCPLKYKLDIDSLNKILNNIDDDIFDSDECILWKGLITSKNNGKVNYINFYFNKQKIILHRLLYNNYIKNINNKQYIKYSCDNKGICCNLKHMYVIEKLEKPKKSPIIQEHKKFKKIKIKF